MTIPTTMRLMGLLVIVGMSAGCGSSSGSVDPATLPQAPQITPGVLLPSVTSALQRRISKSRLDGLPRPAPDGDVLSVELDRPEGVINLGSQAGVHAGLKFQVCELRRVPSVSGSFPAVVAQAVVTQVLGPHSSTIRIESLEDPERPVTRGCHVRNPFFSAGEPVHVHLAGDFAEHQQRTIRTHLNRMNTVLDTGISGDTDYVVVSDVLAATAANENDDETDVLTPYGKVVVDARTYGARLITEDMLHMYADY